ncbi:MAG: DUF2183 domain-containing protein [Bdellovibrionales bacterium]|nr:DUF2183 domain-containing protein [Bdellovibrionales bacterium]
MRIFAFLLATLFATSVFAKTILISDIDDTIKIAHINDFMGKIEQAFDLDMFWGMNTLYNYLNDQVVEDIYYVTNAPDWLMREQHKEFLKAHKFPAGQIFFRSGSAEIHKMQSIQQIINESKPKKVILIGDDAEDDIDIYSKISKNNSGLKFYTFIKTNYSQKKLKNEQVGFVTPVGILIDLNNKKELYNSIYTEKTIDQVVSILEGNSSPMWDDDDQKILLFPAWVNCQKWKPVKSENLSPIFINKYNKIISIRCSYLK